MEIENLKKDLIIDLILSLIISIIINSQYCLQIPELNQMKEFQFNLFTVTSVMEGFSFTTLGIILGLSSEPIIKKLKGTTILAKKCESTAKSIFFFIFSGIISLLFIFGIFELEYISKTIKHFYILGVLFLILGFIYFIKSVYETYKLIIKIFDISKDEKDRCKRCFVNKENKKDNDDYNLEQDEW